MDNLNLLDQIYELEASCSAIVAEAKERAVGMEAYAKQEAAQALAKASNEIYESQKLAALDRKKRSQEKLEAERLVTQSSVQEALVDAQARKSLAVAALVERALG